MICGASVRGSDEVVVDSSMEGLASDSGFEAVPVGSSCCHVRSCSLAVEMCNGLLTMLHDVFCDILISEGRIGVRAVASDGPAREVKASRSRRWQAWQPRKVDVIVDAADEGMDTISLSEMALRSSAAPL